MGGPSDALLRTLAAVRLPARVAVVGGGAAIADALVRLGFEVRAERDAAALPSAWADWVVAAAPPAPGPALAEAARVLRPGAWVWVEADAEADRLGEAAARAGLLAASEPVTEGGAVRAVYRRPGGARERAGR